MTKDMDLMEVVKQTAFNTQSISDQMGIVATTLKNHDIAIRELREDRKADREDFENYKLIQKEKEFAEPARVQELADAVKNRVSDICNEFGCYDMYGSFSRKAWIDAKKFANVVGKGGVYTRQMHVDEAIEYIGTWKPHGYGIQGYIDHLKLVAKRSKKSA